MPQDNPKCILPWTAVFVLENGDVFNCCHQIKPFGNIKDGPFEEVFNSPDIQKIRLALLRGDMNTEYCRCLEKIGKIPEHAKETPSVEFNTYVPTDMTSKDISLKVL